MQRMWKNQERVINQIYKSNKIYSNIVNGLTFQGFIGVAKLLFSHELNNRYGQPLTGASTCLIQPCSL